ncbi:glycoside hydrolase family 113 [Flavobacterium soyangense]|uniref:Glycoside hydrolase n=1 Tax=Flavobacterium soyangense TaxID=2023265 RepID=A0A930UFN5_9FLAO|nr:glycoside hydrolase [Flavobacterium soyangense]MBF2709600.1 glycoside hydrolase [Flavobacterium soyangense]
MNLQIVYIGILFSIFSCNSNQDTIAQRPAIKEPVVANFDIKGVNYVATNSPINIDNIIPLANINCGWISQVPFAFCKLNSPTVRFDPVNSWWGESDLGITTTTNLAKSRGIKTMMKPQLWVMGSYTGVFTLSSESDWLIWENDYRNYILHFATLSETLGIEMFCIGTEMKLVVQNRPAFWNDLIDRVRKVYRGKLIYAANWDEYLQVPFWDKLDYIGIDAYFPVSNSITPTVDEVVTNWNAHINKINQLRNTFSKNVIFTEIGYKSVDKTTFEPWNPTSTNLNFQAQTNAYQGFFEAFANKSWFKGAFLWKWYPKNETSGGLGNEDYTPQNKPVEALIKKCF